MPEPYELDWVRLPLEGAHNVRELGGYPTEGGGQTRYHRFLRSDGLNEITPADAAFLHAYGVRLVLDLRDPDEVFERPDISLGDDVQIVNVPLLDVDISDREALEKRFATEPPTYEFFYEMVLNKREQMARCFRLIAQVPTDACVLFHCAVGKDRTGILAMLLMALAGCDKWDCVANYIQTRANLMRHDWYVVYWENGDANDPLSDSPASAMEFTWERLQEMGGIVPYLHESGVTYEEIEAVRAHLVA